jgi:hypothetical protein
MHKRQRLSLCALALTGLWLPVAHAACDAPFCSLNTDWDVQSKANPGAWGAGLRFAYSNQDQLRNGSHYIGIDQVPARDQEIRTIYRHWVASLDHDFNTRWSMSIDAPILIDDHAHLDSSTGAPVVQAWHFHGLGDVFALGRYRFSSANQNTGSGLELGLKLPTGAYDDTNNTGLRAERSVQPGTGTTDAVLGLYYTRRNPDLGVTTILHASWQAAIRAREDFRPGETWLFDAGIRRQTTPKVASLIQFHAVINGRDTGSQADHDSSGGSGLFLSPGVSYAPRDRLTVYGYFQQPLLRRVNGAQLTADWSIVAGVGYTFGGTPKSESQ